MSANDNLPADTTGIAVSIQFAGGRTETATFDPLAQPVASLDIDALEVNRAIRASVNGDPNPYVTRFSLVKYQLDQEL
ncbi:hypothetical protein BM1_03441 [Bipolaris maydis]|nr:hypothetical protein BM1_03441 [Bipolaris maydis]